MSKSSAQDKRQERPPGSGLRPNALAAVVMLLIEFGLGIGVNLYSTLPAADLGKGLFPGFGAAVTHGPTLLIVHALLGTLLLATGATAVVRSLRLRRLPQITLTSTALVGLLVAWLSGSSFVGKQTNGASLTMALATAAAMLCYTLILFITAGRPHSCQDSPISKMHRENRFGAEVDERFNARPESGTLRFACAWCHTGTDIGTHGTCDRTMRSR